MRILLLIVLILFNGFISGFCQKEAVMISPAMFEKSVPEIFLFDLDGWRFHKGTDASWAQREINEEGWQAMKPTQLHAGMADENGRLEGWFRIRLKPDLSFGNDSFYIRAQRWAAMDVYLDGKLIRSFGNTAQTGANAEFRSLMISPVPFKLIPGSEHVMAVHLVDYVTLLPFNRLKSDNLGGLKSLIRLHGPDYFIGYIRYLQEITRYPMIWLSVCFLLSLLFWLIFLQNRQEANLLLIALAVTAFTINISFIYYSQSSGGISYLKYSLFKQIANLGAGLFQILLMLLVVRLFKRKETRSIRLFLTLYAVLFVLDTLFSDSSFNFLLVLLLYGFCGYHIFSSWRNLKGAHWAIVVGLLGTLAFTIGYTINFFIYKTILFPNALMYGTGIYLSFPVSLLVYVATRFREIIGEVRLNAQQVIRLVEEKKDQALQQQKLLEEEVARQTEELRHSLENLKATQAQLIQSEKMASLGELTAGIAHEIQNPLNFINNFSEINKELADELEHEIDEGNYAEAKTIAGDIKGNEEKIMHHGKRADGIVKGMLQHSRSSSGIKEPTDINALCDEYLRISYHGLRAKDKSFNAAIKTEFDVTIGHIHIIPQDIGRVLLNLVNNAFYAVDEKKKSGIHHYEPTVSVSTKKINGKVEISVADNGNGIPQKLMDKIFQPFFTTKPTGQGTGLGLSLSYDIVKAHGGELKVETSEGKGTKFSILLNTTV